MMVGRLRWATSEGGGGRWEADAETAATMEGSARAVPADPLPLGLSRGARVTRPKQLDFMHRFMSLPLLPSFSPRSGPLLHRANTFHLSQNWSATILEQFHVQKILSFLKGGLSNHVEEKSWHEIIKKHMHDVLSLGFGTELLIAPDSTILVETYDVFKENRVKAIYHHKASFVFNSLKFPLFINALRSSVAFYSVSIYPSFYYCFLVNGLERLLQQEARPKSRSFSLESLASAGG